MSKSSRRHSIIGTCPNCVFNYSLICLSLRYRTQLSGFLLEQKIQSRHNYFSHFTMVQKHFIIQEEIVKCVSVAVTTLQTLILRQITGNGVQMLQEI